MTAEYRRWPFVKWYVHNVIDILNPVSKMHKQSFINGHLLVVNMVSYYNNEERY